MKNLCRKISVLALLFALMLTLGGIPAYADSFSPPEPFEIWSEDKTTVFRWCPRSEETQTFRGTAQAGVYRDDRLIYSVNNLPTIGVHAGAFLFSADFRHFVFITQVDQVMAFGFFEDGLLLRAYRIDELVRDLNVVTYSVTMAMWENWRGRNFDTANNTLTIVTLDDITYVFDITTGEIIYDTAGDKPFIPHPEDSWGYSVNDGELPLWAQDVPSSWAVEAIERAGELGILPDGFRFGFGRSTTRAEFATIAVSLYEHFSDPITGRVTFTDTTDPNVEKAAYLGIVLGVGDNRFDPYSPLTREQAAVMLMRLFSAINVTLNTNLPAMLDLPHLSDVFTDYEQVSSWAFNGVASAYALGIMRGVGDNRFDPGGSYTREQSIITVLRLFDMVSTELSNAL